MFSGIVEESGRIVRVDHQGVNVGSRLVIESNLDHSSTTLGDSIAIEGCCLTVVAIDRPASGFQLSFDAAPETLRKTTLGVLASGDRVNLERSMRIGDRVHGHFVSGHVDASVQLLERTADGNSLRLVWELPPSLRSYVAPKGSITLAGVSLTVGEVTEKSFGVYIIPHTADVTTLASKAVGQSVNVEIDMLARYVKTILAASGAH